MGEKKETKGRKRRRETKVLSGRVSPQIYDAVEKIIEAGKYVDVTDYLREIVRKDLESRGISLRS